VLASTSGSDKSSRHVCSANHAHITCSTLICAVINQLLTLVSLVTKCGLGGIAGTTSAAGSTRTSSSRQVRLLLPPTPPPVLHPAPFNPRLLAPLFFLVNEAKIIYLFFKKMKITKIFCVPSERKRRWQKLLHVFERERKKKDLIREVESCRTPHPFQLLGWRLLVWQIRSVRRSHVSTLLVWVACTHQQIPATRALGTRGFCSVSIGFKSPLSKRTTSISKFVWVRSLMDAGVVLCAMQEQHQHSAPPVVD